MPAASDPSFSGLRKASFTPGEDFDSSAPMVTKYNKAADGTTLKDFRTPDRNGNLIQSSRPKKSDRVCPRWCTTTKGIVIGVILLIILLLIIILPSTLIKSKKSEKQSTAAAITRDSLPLAGNFSAKIRPTPTGHYANFLDYLTLAANHNLTTHNDSSGNGSDSASVTRRPKRGVPVRSGHPVSTVELLDHNSTERDYLTMKLTKMVMDAARNSPICEMGKCINATVTHVRLSGHTGLRQEELLTARFEIHYDPKSEFQATDKEEIDSVQSQIATNMAGLFGREFPHFQLVDGLVGFAFSHFCGLANLTCNGSTVDRMSLSNATMLMKNRTDDTTNLTEVVPMPRTGRTEVSENLTSTSEAGDLRHVTTVSVLPIVDPVELSTIPPAWTHGPVIAVKSIPVGNCSGYGFTCANQKQTVGSYERCDGKRDCQDGSDEEFCRECKTSFKCPTDTQGTFMCLQGTHLCDRKRDCPSGLDESPLYCKSRCLPGLEYKCRGHDICIPVSFTCDGDIHCPLGDDEANCDGRTGCNNNAFLCRNRLRCVAYWRRCDGVPDCSDGSDELDCDCVGCSGDGVAMCNSDRGKCISWAQLCNGREDCPNGQDEVNCPGWCKLDGPVDLVTCADGIRYPRRHACSGRVVACESSCPVCDAELSFQCRSTRICVSRAKVCDGSPDCTDGSDESPTICSCSGANTFQCRSKPLRCLSPLRLCDGFSDCPGGEDESNCSSCVNNPGGFFCRPTQKCLTSDKRCDGIVDCPDYSDEDNCTCSACKSHYGYQTFYCRNGGRCLHQSYVCNPQSPYHCPGSPPEDESFCAT